MGYNKQNTVILVNERDEWVGLEDKLKAHQDGSLHRAFSVFVLNSNNEMLIQKRADDKYHSGGMWSNTCCSHPYWGESTQNGAKRRLQEEMGFDCEVEEIFSFRYHADVGNGLTENEYDHVYLGYFNGLPKLNEKEVSDYRFIDIEELRNWVSKEPQTFTAWFRLVLPKFIKYFSEHKKVA